MSRSQSIQMECSNAITSARSLLNGQEALKNAVKTANNDPDTRIRPKDLGVRNQHNLIKKFVEMTSNIGIQTN